MVTCGVIAADDPDRCGARTTRKSWIAERIVALEEKPVRRARLRSAHRERRILHPDAMA
jgi:hypothetical protein